MEKEKESLQIRIRRVQRETSVCKTIDPRAKEKETQEHVTYVDALVTWLKTAGILVRWDRLVQKQLQVPRQFRDHHLLHLVGCPVFLNNSIQCLHRRRLSTKLLGFVSCQLVQVTMDWCLTCVIQALPVFMEVFMQFTITLVTLWRTLVMKVFSVVLCVRFHMTAWPVSVWKSCMISCWTVGQTPQSFHLACWRKEHLL